MRVLPGLQNLLTTVAGPRQEVSKAAQALDKAQPLSFVDQASITVQGVEPPKPTVVQAVKAKVASVFRVPRRHEQLLAEAHRAGTHGRVATYRAQVHPDLPVGAVAAGSARIRLIPAKAIDFGFASRSTATS